MVLVFATKLMMNEGLHIHMNSDNTPVLGLLSIYSAFG